MSKLNFIQVLRGFAAIAVLLYHIDGSTQEYFNYKLFHFTYGYLGVDFFFALSGFIITYVHLKDIEQRGSVRNFIVKRAVRIYPLYWLVLPIVIALQSPDFAHKPDLNWVLTTWDGVLKNIFLFPIKIEYMPVGVAWSLIYELVFYAVFALCIALGWKFARVFFFVWVALILIGSRDIFEKGVIAEHLIGNIIIEFLAGCVVGYLFVKGKDLHLKYFLPSLLITSALLFVYLTFREFNRWAISFAGLLAVMSGLIIWFAATMDRAKKYAPPLLVLIGNASYSIYITHTIYVGLFCQAIGKAVNFRALSGWLQPTIVVALFFVSLLAGVVIHLLIEKPMLHYFRKKLSVRPSMQPIVAKANSDHD